MRLRGACSRPSWRPGRAFRTHTGECRGSVFLRSVTKASLVTVLIIPCHMESDLPASGVCAGSEACVFVWGMNGLLVLPLQFPFPNLLEPLMPCGPSPDCQPKCTFSRDHCSFKAMAKWHAEREAVKARAKGEAPPEETLDLSKPKEEESGDEDIN